MNRRKAIKNIFGTVALAISGFTGYKLYKLKKFSNIADITNYNLLLADLSETIIPITHTPGAKQANVSEFIISVLINCSSNQDQNIFINGLDDIINYCNKKYNKSFSDCSALEKEQVVQHFENRDIYQNKLINKVNSKLFGQPFFIQLKSLTIQGYCMSFLGATKGLAYDYIPSTFQACVPVIPGQLSWATK